MIFANSRFLKFFIKYEVQIFLTVKLNYILIEVDEKKSIYHSIFTQLSFFKILFYKQCVCQKKSSVLNKNYEKIY